MSLADQRISTRPRSSYRPDIDGLRAIAVTLVLLYHCGVPGPSGGYIGVDIFFVISGYLITGHLAEDITNGHLSVARFYERRIRRILPALLFVLIMTWIASLFLLLPSYLLLTSKATVAAAVSVSNIYLWRANDYFAVNSAFQPLLHTWSLSVEEQFYLFIPLLMKMVGRKLDGKWIWLFLPLCLASLALSAYGTRTAATATFYLLPTRAWELGLGSILATTPLSPVTRRSSAELAGIVALLLIFVPAFLFDDNTPFPGINALYPCLGGAILIHVGRSAKPFVTSLMSTRPFVGIGLISYSLYLVHWPIISLMRFRSAGVLSHQQIVIVLVASIGLAFLTWRFVEQPFRTKTPVLKQRGVLLGGLGGIVLTCLVGLTGIVFQGFPGRFPNFKERDIPGREEWQPEVCFLTKNMRYAHWSRSHCTIVKTGQHKVLLWGDSFAAQYVPGLIAHGDALKATIIQYTAAGCLPVLFTRQYGLLPCREFSDSVLKVIDEEHIDTVLLAGKWTNKIKEGFGELSDTLAFLHKRGIRTVVIGQSPEFATGVQVISYLEGAKSPDAVNRWHVDFPIGINDKIAKIVGPGFIDPMPVLCTGALCTYEDHGTFLFADYGHYSAAGSSRVVQALIPQLSRINP